MAKPDIDGLARSVRKKDRVPPACFAGRKKLIEDVDEALEAVMVEAGKPDGDASGLTLLVQGAPGAGKTALLGELARRFREKEVRRLTDEPDRPVEGVPVAVALRAADLDDERRVVTAIVRALKQAELKEREFRRTKKASGIFQPGLEFFRIGAGAGYDEAPPEARFEVLLEKLPPSAWTRPVCLMVDEVQTVGPAAKEVLDKLHNAMRGLPVLAGPGDIHHHLSGVCGLTRFAMGAIHDIGLLAPEEAAASVLGFFEAFHVDLTDADPRAWAERLSAESDGWPQHLHNGQGLWRRPWSRPAGASPMSMPSGCSTGRSGSARTLTGGKSRRKWGTHAA